MYAHACAHTHTHFAEIVQCLIQTAASLVKVKQSKIRAIRCVARHMRRTASVPHSPRLPRGAPWRPAHRPKGKRKPPLARAPLAAPRSLLAPITAAQRGRALLSLRRGRLVCLRAPRGEAGRAGLPGAEQVDLISNRVERIHEGSCVLIGLEKSLDHLFTPD